MPKSVALVVFGDENSTRNILTEDGFKPLADALVENGFAVESVLFHDSRMKYLEQKLPEFYAIMLWVDPIVQGVDRRLMDEILSNAAKNGTLVSTHPDIIAKIGTKEVLYTTKKMDWGSDVQFYPDYQDFEKRFVASLSGTGIRVLKKHRGSSGNGIYKVYLAGNNICVVAASSPEEERILSRDDFHKEWRGYFEGGGMLIDQQWSDAIANGMVRAYITGNKVTGFGYQESVALCPLTYNDKLRAPGRRYYFSEHCGMFQDLRGIMESKWIPQLQKIHSITDEAMPLLWDVDFFINDVNTPDTVKKYTMCEINVSGVSPFPPSCIPHIVNAIKSKLA